MSTPTVISLQKQQHVYCSSHFQYQYRNYESKKLQYQNSIRIIAGGILLTAN